MFHRWHKYDGIIRRQMLMTTQIQIEKAEQRRAGKAKQLAGKGLVQRSGDGFVVKASGRKSAGEYLVRRDQLGIIRCDCPEYQTESYVEIGFRCEHILAVKYAIAIRNTEPAQPFEHSGSLASENVEREAADAFPNRSGDRPPRELDLNAFRLNVDKGETSMNTRSDTVPEFSPESGNVLDFSTTLRELRKNVDPQLVRKREAWRDRTGNRQMVDYVEWHTVADILDETAPSWAHTVRNMQAVGEIMTVTVAITIDGITREGIGTGSALSESGIKKAEHDALKRAAVKFGIARDLYRREFDAIEREDIAPQLGGSANAKHSPVRIPDEPVARSMAELVTAKQLGMIRSLGREKNVEAEDICVSMMNCRVNELSRRAASALIEHLQHLDVQRIPIRRAS